MTEVSAPTTTFEGLDFQPHSIGDGVQAKVFYPNGYGASVVRFSGSYGASSGLYEIAVLDGADDEWGLTYETPLTDDVLGYQSESDVSNVLSQIAALPQKS